MAIPLITTPNFTETLLFGPDLMARGSTLRRTADLRAAYGGFVHVQIGRGDATALTVGIGVRVNRLISIVAQGSNVPYSSGGPFVIEHPAPVPDGNLVGGTAAAATTTVNTDSSGVLLRVASITGFAAGDIITIDGAGTYTKWE